MVKMTFALKHVNTNRFFLFQSVVANYSLIVCKVVRGPFVGTNLVSGIFKLTKKLGLYAFSFFFGMFLQSPAFSSEDKGIPT